MKQTHVFLMALAIGSALSLSAQTNYTIQVNDSRPLAAALDALEIHDGITINYEDPPYRESECSDGDPHHGKRVYRGCHL